MSTTSTRKWFARITHLRPARPNPGLAGGRNDFDDDGAVTTGNCGACDGAGVCTDGAGGGGAGDDGDGVDGRVSLRSNSLARDDPVEEDGKEG